MTIDVVPAWTRLDGVCPAFQWIGQPFTSCDNCGQPYWNHTHEEHAADGSNWITARVRRTIITEDQRAACLAKWGPQPAQLT